MDWDYLNPSTYIRPVVSEARGIFAPPPQPGVGKPITDPDEAARFGERAVRDPATGYYYDPATGTSYMDAQGQTPVANPNVAQQVATNYAQQQAYQRELAASREGVRSGVGGLMNLAGQYGDAAAGRGPSVAQSQLRSGFDAITSTQLSGAAGVGGDNSFAARRAALQNIGSAGLRHNQASAELRAREIEAARAGRGQALSAAGNLSQNQYGTDAAAAARSGELALGGQRGQQGIDAQGQAQGQAGGLAALGSVVSLLSDERAKTDVRPEPGGSILAFLDSLAPRSFEYQGVPGERHGVVAQDVEAGSEIGSDLVEEGPGGMKAIPVDQGLGVSLAALGNLHERLRRLEGGGRG